MQRYSSVTEKKAKYKDPSNAEISSILKNNKIPEVDELKRKIEELTNLNKIQNEEIKVYIIINKSIFIKILNSSFTETNKPTRIRKAKKY